MAFKADFLDYNGHFLDFFIEKCINQPLIRGVFCHFWPFSGSKNPCRTRAKTGSGPAADGVRGRPGTDFARPGSLGPGGRSAGTTPTPPETAGVGALAAVIGRLAIQVTIKDD